MCVVVVAGANALYAAADPYMVAANSAVAGGGRIGAVVNTATHSYHPYRR